MNRTKLKEGMLKVTVGSEGRVINAGAHAVISKVISETGYIWVMVTSKNIAVRLNYYDTDVDFLM